jgi:hypothetical protein
MDAADVGMVELGEEAGFGQETGAGPGVQPVATDGLERHRPFELLVEADVHRTHAPFGEVAVDADVANPISRANHEPQISAGCGTARQSCARGIVNLHMSLSSTGANSAVAPPKIYSS